MANRIGLPLMSGKACMQLRSIWCSSSFTPCTTMHAAETFGAAVCHACYPIQQCMQLKSLMLTFITFATVHNQACQNATAACYMSAAVCMQPRMRLKLSLLLITCLLLSATMHAAKTISAALHHVFCHVPECMWLTCIAIPGDIPTA